MQSDGFQVYGQTICEPASVNNNLPMANAFAILPHLAKFRMQLAASDLSLIVYIFNADASFYHL